MSIRFAPLTCEELVQCSEYDRQLLRAFVEIIDSNSGCMTPTKEALINLVRLYAFQRRAEAL